MENRSLKVVRKVSVGLVASALSLFLFLALVEFLALSQTAYAVASQTVESGYQSENPMEVLSNIVADLTNSGIADIESIADFEAGALSNLNQVSFFRKPLEHSTIDGKVNLSNVISANLNNFLDKNFKLPPEALVSRKPIAQKIFKKAPIAKAKVVLQVAEKAPARKVASAPKALKSATPVSKPEVLGESTARNTAAVSVPVILKKNNPVVVPPSKPVQSTANIFVTKADLASQIALVYKDIASRLSGVTQSSSQNLTSIYREISLSQKIDSLSNTTLTNPTITGGTLNGSAVAATTLSVSDVGTSTFAAGVDISSGCFSVAGTCVSSSVGGGAFTNTIASGGTGSTVFSGNSIVVSNSAGTALVATGTQLTVGNLIATTTATSYFLGTVGVGTSAPSGLFDVNSKLTVSNTGFGTTTVTGLTVNGSATSTSNVGFNLTTGCFAISGTCVSGGSFSNTIANGGTGSTVFSGNSILVSNSAGTALVATGTQLTVGNLIATTSATSLFAGKVAFGTSTALWNLSAYASNAPQLALSAGAGLSQWTFANEGGSFYLATTTAQGLATSTNSAISINPNGFVGIASTSPGSLFAINNIVNFDTATTTFQGTGGLNIANGCYSIGGSCLSLSNITGQITLTTQVTGILPVANGGTNSSSFSGNSIIVSNSAGTQLIATGTQLTVGNLIATTTATSFFLGKVGIGTTTPSPISLFTIATSTTPQISFASGIASDSPWVLRSIGGAFFFASSSATTYATSSNSAISINANGFVGIASTSPGSLFAINKVVNFDPATTSFSSVGGVNIATGCFSIAGTCLSATFSNTLANGGTGSTLFAANSIVVSNSAGSALIATGTQLTVGNIIATTTATSLFGGPIALGTTSAPWKFIIASTTQPQIALMASSSDNIFTLRSVGGAFYIATASPTTYGTSTNSAISINANGNVGIGTTSPGTIFSVANILNIDSATTTFQGTGGINIARGCYSLNGSCLTITSFAGTVAVVNGGTGNTAFSKNSIIASDANGNLISTSSQLTVGNLISTTTATSFFVGTVGVGTTTPSPISLFTISTTTTPQISLAGAATDNLFTLRSIGGAFFISSSSPTTFATSTNPAFAIFSTGWVGIGTTTNNLGPLAMNSGAFVTTGGVWTNASSRDLKENFTFVDPFETLEKIMQVPITRWNYKTEDSHTTHIGPIAQDFFAAFETGGANGSVSISTIDPSGVALVGIQGLNMKLESLANATSSSPAATSFVARFFGRLIAWLADKANNIGDVFAGAFHAKDKICVDDQCFTKDDVKALLALIKQTQGSTNNPGDNTGDNTGSQSGSTSAPTDTSSPIITILGENPAHITLGTQYSDMGATVADTDGTGAVNNNLGLHFNVDGVSVESVSIDTATSSAHTVVYSAQDSGGNWGYATRTVEVISPSN